MKIPIEPKALFVYTLLPIEFAIDPIVLIETCRMQNLRDSSWLDMGSIQPTFYCRLNSIH